MGKYLVFLLIAVVTNAAYGQQWTSRQVTNVDDYFLTLDFLTNASGVVRESSKDKIVTTKVARVDMPLVIYSNAKRIAEPVSGACEKGFLQNNNSCYTCPDEFDINESKAPEDHQKCVKSYTDVNNFDSVFTEALLARVEPQFTQRQLRCILKEQQCFTGYSTESQDARYGMNCGLKSKNNSSFLLDNLDKCCLAYEQQKWVNNIAKGHREADSNCANDVNMFRCARKIIVDRHYVTEEEKDAALLIVNRQATPLMSSCPLAVPVITGDDGGAYPWLASSSSKPNLAYTHKFESSVWVRDGIGPADLSDSPQNTGTPLPVIQFSVQ